MKVGTDGVLLGSWANGGKRILDIGTGTGLIALMMAQRYTDATIDAVEIDHDAALQAYENVSNTEFANRIKIVETAIQHHSTQEKSSQREEHIGTNADKAIILVVFL